MKTLGTILPTAASLAVENRMHDVEVQRCAAIAANEAALVGCKARLVGGEVRYYSRESLYAVVRSGKVHWFLVQADGDYAVAVQSNQNH